MLLIIHLSRVLTSFRMLYPGTNFKILIVRVIDGHGGVPKGLRTRLTLLPRIEIRA